MKKVCLIFLSLLFSLVASAQAKQIKTALSSGRQPGSLYHWENPGEAMLDTDKLNEYAAKNHIRLTQVKTKEIGRFGSVSKTVASFSFIPENEHAAFIAESILRNYSKTHKTDTIGILMDFNASYLKKKGSMLYPDPEGDKPAVRRLNDVMWSADVRNDKLEGTGVAVGNNGPYRIVILLGTFVDGVPQGNFNVFSYHSSASDIHYDKRMMNNYLMRFGTTQEGLVSFPYKEKYGYFDTEGNIIIEPKYQNAFDFKDGLATVYMKGVYVDIDKTGRITRLSKDHYLSVDDLLRYSNRPELAEVIKQYIPSIIPFCSEGDLKKIENAYSTQFSQSISERRLEIFRKDAKEIRGYYDKAVAAAANKAVMLDGQSTAEMFFEKYKQLINGKDPDKMKPVITSLRQYYDICQALDLSPMSSYCSLEVDPPVYYGHSDEDVLMNGIYACDEISDPFRDFADYAKPVITEKKQPLADRLRKDYNSYVDAMERRGLEKLRELQKVTVYDDIKHLITRKTVNIHNLKEGGKEYSYEYGFSDIGLFSISQVYEYLRPLIGPEGTYISFRAIGSGTTMTKTISPGEQVITIDEFLVLVYKQAKEKKIRDSYTPARY